MGGAGNFCFRVPQWALEIASFGNSMAFICMVRRGIYSILRASTRQKSKACFEVHGCCIRVSSGWQYGAMLFGRSALC
jgi:hypothetical protein